MEVKMAQKKVYDKEFKVQAVKPGREISFSKAAREPGINVDTLYGWSGGRITGKIAFYCEVLQVSRQGFYSFLKHRDDPWKYEGVAEKMRAIITEDECNDTYGRSRMHDALKQKYPDEDIPGERTVYRIMEAIGISHRPKRKPNGITKADYAFAAAKRHIGIYPGPEAVENFAGELTKRGLKFSKGAIQIPHGDNLPLDLIAEISRWCGEHNCDGSYGKAITEREVY